jgi:hypothetical protein
MATTQQQDIVEALKTPSPEASKGKVPSRMGIGLTEPVMATADPDRDPARHPPQGNRMSLTPEGELAGTPPLLDLPGSKVGPRSAPVAVNPQAIPLLRNLRLQPPSTEWLYEVTNTTKVTVSLRGGKRVDFFPGDRVDFGCHKPEYKRDMERNGVTLKKVFPAEQEAAETPVDE